MTTTRKTRGSASTSPAVVSAEPTGRWAQILQETRDAGLAIEPFEITADLVLQPPTPRRLRALDQTSTAHLLAQSVVVDLTRTAGKPPEDPAARAAWGQARQEELAAAYRQVAAAELAYNEALIGDAGTYRRVQEYFDDRPEWERAAFEKAVKEQFLRLPVDGRCQACGQEVGGQGEPAGESSGGSSTSGISSKGTSPNTSTESTPETGSAAAAPGASSSPTPNASPDAKAPTPS